MKKILVIEDNHDVRENLIEILELSDYQVASAENGKIGVEKAVDEAPDLILCDIMMPELDGFGVLHILSRNQKTMDIPFVFLTAKADKQDFRQGMSLGADDYITKPFDDVELLKTIESRLQKSDRLRKSSTPMSGSLDLLMDEAKAMEAIRHLSMQREIRTYSKKATIFSEEENPRWLYYIESGQVKIFKTNDDGREFIVKISHSGDFLGYLALLNQSPYPESAIALEECQIRLIPKEAFQELVYGNRDVMVRFVKLLANHVAEREQQLLDLAYNSVRRRLATILVKLHNQGVEEIHYLREDLAALAGTTKETTIRTLADFKQEQLVEIKQGVIKILEVQKLDSMPN